MTLNIAIGFITGRKHFQHLLTTYVNNWLERGLIMDKKIRLHLFVAYDLKYRDTKVSDYKDINPHVRDIIDSVNFYGRSAIETEKQRLVDEGILAPAEAEMLFGDGYARKRNAVVYFAMKKKMDRLLFLDDDEYPIAVMKNKYSNLIWMGQSVVGTHIRFSADTDITHGYHCGYISPIPYLQFNGTLRESDFKLFIQSISNEIISWKPVKENIIKNGGVTFANHKIINKQLVSEVPEVQGMKFISGANLCFNLKNCRDRLPPFYNPPGARGEDTFMSTALSDLKVKKLPVYTFHDGFLQYRQILMGSLPITLQPVDAAITTVVSRFVAATVGWIRYKPLMLYITKRDQYEEIIKKMQHDLTYVIPKLNTYFHTDQFDQLLKELVFYHKNVERHYRSFSTTKRVWKKLMKTII